MKKLTAMLIVFILLFTLSSCGKSSRTTVIENTFSLEEMPIVEEGSMLLKTNGTKFVELNFEVPQSGYIKLRGFDASENDNTDYPTATVSFFNADGKKIAEGLNADNGFSDRVKVDKGPLTARLKFSKGYDKMERISVVWAFAPDNNEILEARVDGGPVVARANDKKEATFKLKVAKTGMYRVYCSEACLAESDCGFYVKKSGESITSDFYIHGSEWTWRRVFLTPGEYEIVLTEIRAVAECKVTLEESADDVHLSDVEDAELPVRVGFMTGETTERTVTFTPNESGLLVIEAIGSCTDNDGGQDFAVTVTDSNGYSEVHDECFGDTDFNLENFSGKITVKITLNGGGIALLRIYNPENNM